MTIGAALGDLHLGRQIYGYDLTPHTRRIMYRFFRLCLKREADYAVQLGDLFDSPRPAPGLEKIVVQWCNEFERAHLPLFLLTGNHDVISKPGHTSALDAIKAMPYKYVRVIDRPLALAIPNWSRTDKAVVKRRSQHTALFMPFPSVSTYLDPDDWKESVLAALGKAERLKRPIVGYSHLDVIGAKWGSQDIVLRGSDFAIPKEVRRSRMVREIVAGHIHGPQKVKKVRVVGAAQRLRIDEAEHTRYFYFARNGKPLHQGKVLIRDAVRMLDLRMDASVGETLELENIDIRGETQQDLLDELSSLLDRVYMANNVLVRVQVWVNANTVLDWNEIERKLYKAGALFVYPMTPQQKPSEAQAETKRLAIDPDKAARQFIRDRIKVKKERLALMKDFRTLREETGV